ncbi:hypothetical protein L9F63_015937 [Diploptera punctata]|uniref:UBX domain-containing protein 4 n=1 Tax=Diploptera punctata TaxID=6984 RepID=A0AAD8A4N5_DIPPU|nr:hypothetical protein L9F63_015937 [Diploptera punctata]
MRWFEGGIAEAVATSKAKNAIFVVFVNGQDDVSRTAAVTVDSEAVSSKLETEDFVAIKLESDSETYRQFVQIYQLVPVPSLFFIGGNGAPLEIIAGHVEETELVQKIDSVLQKSKPTQEHNERSSEAMIQEAIVSSQNEGAVASAVSDETRSDSQPYGAEVSLQDRRLLDVSCEPTSDALNTEQKIERAKELMEKKRKQKQEEEEQKERLKEVERRKMGQDVQKLRRWQQEQELKQLKEERQREKAEEAAARDRILKQIAQDKAERAVRFGQEKKVTPDQEPARQPVSQSSMNPMSTSNVARIQFRLPDGSTHSMNFEPTTTVGEIRSYATTQLNLPFRDFSMSTSFPRREFSVNDDNQTLRDVQLVPTAVILILPMSGSVVSSSSHDYAGTVSRMVWTLLAPLFSLFTYLRNLVFGGGGAGNNLGQNNSKRESSFSTDQSSTGARRRRPGAETSVHRQGNVHRLSNQRDSSDDENNTWNGNSTQQM